MIDLLLKTAYGMIATGEIVDAKTIILLEHAKLAQAATSRKAPGPGMVPLRHSPATRPC